MALCDSDRCAWSSCSLVVEDTSAGGPVSSLTTNGFSNGSRNTLQQLQPGNGVKLSKEDAFSGVKSTFSARSKSNGSVSLPFNPKCKPRSCILGIGTAIPDRVFPMSEFAKAILQGYGVDTPEVREFSARICKIINIQLLN